MNKHSNPMNNMSNTTQILLIALLALTVPCSLKAAPTVQDAKTLATHTKCPPGATTDDSLADRHKASDNEPVKDGVCT